MKRFMVLHYGFEKPTPEEFEAWNRWFASIAERQVERGGFRSGWELTPEGSKELPFGRDAITGYTIIEAEDLDEAEAIARECPIVISTRVYEIRG